MIKKIITIACLALLSQTVFAETCPSVADVKSNAIKGWQAYDSDDGTPLSTKRETQFRSSVVQFALAEWTKSGRIGGTIHCYYRDNSGSSLEAYLAKENFQPRNANNYWYEVSGYMHCAAGKEMCQFNTKGMGQSQLARK